MSVDEAVSNYDLIQSDSRILKNNIDPQKADITIYYSTAQSSPLNTTRTNKASRLFYNRDIYAIEFLLRDPGVDVLQILHKITKDFKKKYTTNQTEFGNTFNYYTLEINECENICVYEKQNARDMDYTNAIHVVFTYRVPKDKIPIFIQNYGSLIAD